MFNGSQQERRYVERRNRDKQLLRCERELEAASRITSALFEHLVLDDLVVKALHIALEVVDAECGSILLADSSSKQLIFQYSIGTSPICRDRHSMGSRPGWNRLSIGEAHHYPECTDGLSPSRVSGEGNGLLHARSHYSALEAMGGRPNRCPSSDE